MQAWQEFIKKQEKLLGSTAAQKWLHPLKVIHFDSANLYLEAKDSFQALWFEEHIRPLLKSELLNNNFRPIKVHLTVQDSTPRASSNKQAKKEDLAPRTPIQLLQDKVDPAMTLENFIASDANTILLQFFYELTGYDPETKTVKKPTCSLGAFNPIYLWGNSGSGKTHLLMALAQLFKNQGLNALYARAETFTEHVVSAIRSSEMQLFRKAYRHVDILLVDDVHLLAKKAATQEEFFHTFNALHTTGRQIILSSKCSTALLEEIEPRLVSRFEWGINLHFETLRSCDLKEVLKRRCEDFHFPLSEEVSEFLIETFTSSKSLHQALEALILRCHLEKKSNSLFIDKGSAQKMLADLCLEEERQALSPEKIIASTAAAYGIRKEDLLGKSQSQECSLPRQIAMYLCRQQLKIPFQGIGDIFSRDHSTVMTSVRQIEKRVEASDRELLASLAEIRAALQ